MPVREDKIIGNEKFALEALPDNRVLKVSTHAVWSEVPPNYTKGTVRNWLHRLEGYGYVERHDEGGGYEWQITEKGLEEQEDGTE